MAMDPASRKRRAVELDDTDHYPPRALAVDRPAGRTLGGDRPVLPPYEGEVVQLRPAYVPKTIVDLPSEKLQLAVPPVKTLITLKWDAETSVATSNTNGSSNTLTEDGDAERLEARNFADLSSECCLACPAVLHSSGDALPSNLTSSRLCRTL